MQEGHEDHGEKGPQMEQSWDTSGEEGGTEGETLGRSRGAQAKLERRRDPCGDIKG